MRRLATGPPARRSSWRIGRQRDIRSSSPPGTASTRGTYSVTVTRKAAEATQEALQDAVTVTLSVTPNTVDEGSPVTVRATLSKALQEDVTIPLSNDPGHVRGRGSRVALVDHVACRLHVGDGDGVDERGRRRGRRDLHRCAGHGQPPLRPGRGGSVLGAGHDLRQRGAAAATTAADAGTADGLGSGARSLRSMTGKRRSSLDAGASASRWIRTGRRWPSVASFDGQGRERGERPEVPAVPVPGPRQAEVVAAT